MHAVKNEHENQSERTKMMNALDKEPRIGVYIDIHEPEKATENFLGT